MKKITLLLSAFILSAQLFAQAPNSMSYQAIVRNAGNNLVTNQTVGMRISILKGSSSGTAVYVETQTPTTNANGLVSIQIGGGSVVSGTFSAINWANDSYYVKTETDPAGGTSYSITGTSQLLSVPYALYAKTSGGLSGGVSFTNATVGGTTNITITDVNVSAVVVNFGGSAAGTSTINVTLPAASSYPAGHVIYFIPTAFITSNPSWNITSSGATYSALNSNGLTMNPVALGAGNNFRMVTDGISKWFRIM
ncbi:hypothetical protein [Parasegetibacter sp. NRK P23]|uniref:hypothetical protein n=1 Tax=Parasegetibacter sp. NRK P23 TaxID=2942999 RepID=UPI0020436B4B|nr:hypothetical protein [Parasegetibacter sp. NRK P23]MCM5529671.1 hypothetical protein [Parasegetibacter sp. NRK P23]